MQITPLEAAAVVAIALATLRLPSSELGDTHGPAGLTAARSIPASSNLAVESDLALAKARARK
jgi:hypothetical protein